MENKVVQMEIGINLNYDPNLLTFATQPSTKHILTLEESCLYPHRVNHLLLERDLN